MGNCLPKIRWKVRIPIRRKRYSHKETQTYSYPPSTIKEHFAKNDAMNSSELWYSTVRHNVKHEASVSDINNQTEYALINVPKGKKNIASTEQQNEYDYVLI
ncbi:hypothetical protein QYF61_021061 [Mycteria americana]|uniref:Uncharacterized protein n=1 Tax=Mycteria americana TaxID=33587 RepID=A0AAN7NVX0_MYCAM|nr:hypothetical protein QYF61_021061 [Mycteria americana]